MITQEKLKELLSYDQFTGEFRYLSRVTKLNKCYIGEIAGSIWQGYRSISLFHKNYQCHKLAFLYMTGIVPKLVDHINGITSDNRWRNLREATPTENARNKGIARNNTTGFTGLLKTKNNKWEAYVWENYKPIRIGRFETFDLAVEARKNAAEKYYGAFSPHSRPI
jgi:hypothetical protein